MLLLNVLNVYKLLAQNQTKFCQQLNFETEHPPFFTFNSCFIASHHIQKLEVTVSKKPDFKTVKSAVELWVYDFNNLGQCMQLKRYHRPVKSSKHTKAYADSTIYVWTYAGTFCIAQRVLENTIWKSVYRVLNKTDSAFVQYYTEEIQNPFIKSSEFPYILKSIAKDSIGIQKLSAHVTLQTYFNMQHKPYKEIISQFYSDGSLESKSEHYFAAPWMQQMGQWHKNDGLLKRYEFTFQNNMQVKTERRFTYDSRGVLYADSVFTDTRFVQQSAYLINSDGCFKSIVLQSIDEGHVTIFDFKYTQTKP